MGVEGTLFKTNKGELTIQAASIRLLSKSLRPLPEKFHGLTDMESRYRQRYVDLIVNPESRRAFEIRSKLVQSVREFFVARGYLDRRGTSGRRAATRARSPSCAAARRA